ncbi:hypothetical protein [Stenotrophomonas rhizophila]|uniref:hypothetical protein n=1 Tax=Stenotrophomonas rhizophila TaxID=216778 RepID=UPI0028A5BCCE|nr:hypothetical protein [Stenotrophomonas rhizophila]
MTVFSVYSPPVRAQDKNCKLEASQCSVGEALAQCQSNTPGAGNLNIPGGVTRSKCIRAGSTASGYFYQQYWGKNISGTEVGVFIEGNWYWRNKCNSEPAYTGAGPWSSGGAAKNGSIGCRNGCDGVWFSNSDSTKTWSATGAICPDDEKSNCDKMGDGYYWNDLLKVCEPPEGKCPGGVKPNSLGQCAPEPCPSGMLAQADGTCKKKDNECPAGQIKSPDGKCLPGDGDCAQGEARGKDGTCKRDSNNDGEPDEGEEEGEGPGGQKVKENFEGGDDCSSPPSCSGSPILCGQARIQWRIDCNTRKNRNIAGGSCAAMPVCTGEKCDALEYSGLLMQWRTACAVEKLAQGTGGGDGSQPAWTSVAGMSQDPGAGATANDTKVLTVKKLNVDDLDQSGFGGGGGCIGFVAGGGTGMASGFAQSLASPPAYFCSYIALIRAVLILSAAVTSAYILTSGGKS